MQYKDRKQIPLHRYKMFPGNGVYTMLVNMDEIAHDPVDYAHRDDYYIFGIIVKGMLRLDIDFEERVLKEGELHFIHPGQVHRFIDSENIEALMLIADSCLLTDSCRLIFERSAIRGNAVSLSISEMDELKSLFEIIHRRMGGNDDGLIVRNLAGAFIGILAERFQQSCGAEPSIDDRPLDIVLKLNSLLDSDIHKSHSPSYYSDKLYISPAYLNEVVNKVTGLNTQTYIRNEIILRAKRLLYHTKMTVKEIALSLGFEDNAYFSRMFTKSAGISPRKFRKNP